MRLLFVQVLLLAVGLVAATQNVAADARVRARNPAPTAVSHTLQKRVCYFLIFCFPDPKPSTTSTRTSATPTATSSVRSTSSVGPTTTAAPTTSDTTPDTTATPTNQTTSAINSTTTSPPTSTAAPTTLPPKPTSWSYPQPPLPAKTVSAPSWLFTASAGSYIPSFGQTRRYTFNLEYASGAPSGFQRSMMVINGMYPAPLIEANRGDTLIITVNNRLDLPQSLHWHGIRQNYTNSEDGVPGISQCSIPPGGSYTYRFKLDTEVGTYWYHSHYSNTYADGLTGAIIVHSPDDPWKKYQHFDSERITYLSDWQNDQSEVIAHGLLDLTKGYRGSALPPNPDAVLIDGVGQSDCKVAQAGVRCFQTSPSVTRVTRGTKVKFRLINTGAHATLRYSIDKHELSIVEVDDTAVQPVNVHEVTLAPGQRMSVIVTMNKGNVGDAFWIRATTAGACLGPNIVSTKAILWYTDFLGLTWFSSGIPRTEKWHDLADPVTAPCRDTDQEHHLVPMIREDSPATAVQAHTLDSAFGRFIHPDGTAYIGFGYNETPFINYINNPLLSQLEKGLELNGAHVASVTYNNPTNSWSAVDLIINNKDPAFLAHPFHIHGRPFHILARGPGSLSSSAIPTLQLNTNNPFRRDTLVIGGNEWVLLRFITDNPGVWPIHCHIGWHLAVGKLGVLVMRPDEIKKFTQPGAWSGLCAGTDPNEIGPARRRSLPPQARNADLDDEPRYPGGVQDFTPAPPGVTKGEYFANGTHWWVQDTPYGGIIPEDQRVPEKRHFLESRTVFMNETDWWIPGTVYYGKITKPITEAETKAAPDPNSNVVIIDSAAHDAGVPGPGGNALVEPAEIIGTQVIDQPRTTLENGIPPGFTPSAVNKAEAQATNNAEAGGSVGKA